MVGKSGALIRINRLEEILNKSGNNNTNANENENVNTNKN